MPSKDFRFGIPGSVKGVDLNHLLISHPLSTYFMRLAVDVPELDLYCDDVALVDRSLRPKKTDIVVVVAMNDPELKVVKFSELREELELWGVVECVIRKLR